MTNASESNYAGRYAITIASQRQGGRGFMNVTGGRVVTHRLRITAGYDSESTAVTATGTVSIVGGTVELLDQFALGTTSTTRSLATLNLNGGEAISPNGILMYNDDIDYVTFNGTAFKANADCAKYLDFRKNSGANVTIASGGFPIEVANGSWYGLPWLRDGVSANYPATAGDVMVATLFASGTNRVAMGADAYAGTVKVTNAVDAAGAQLVLTGSHKLIADVDATGSEGGSSVGGLSVIKKKNPKHIYWTTQSGAWTETAWNNDPEGYNGDGYHYVTFMDNTNGVATAFTTVNVSGDRAVTSFDFNTTNTPYAFTGAGSITVPPIKRGGGTLELLPDSKLGDSGNSLTLEGGYLKVNALADGLDTVTVSDGAGFDLTDAGSIYQPSNGVALVASSGTVKLKTGTRTLAKGDYLVK